MVDQTSEPSGASPGREPARVDVLDYLAILLKWRKFLLINFIAVVAVATIVAFLLPKWYKATASILPPKDQGLSSLFGFSASALRGLPFTQKLGGMGGQNMGAYNYLAILKSRSAMEAVVKKFDLVRVYDVSDSSLEKAILELEDNVTFDTQDENYITISVWDTDAQRAADMTNYFVDVLNAISIRLGTLEARSNREFIEKRLDLTRQNLKDAENALRAYQETSGMIVNLEQNSSSVSAIAELYAMKAKKEVELAILEQRVTGDNDLLQQLKLELRELNKKIQTIPQVGLASLRLFRDAAIAQKIVEYLLPLYEQAKIDEQKDVPVILVLDKAVRPEKKDKPKRMILIGLTGGGATLLAILAIMAIESMTASGFLAEARQRFRRKP